MTELVNGSLGSKRYLEEVRKRVKGVYLQRSFSISGKYSILITWDGVEGETDEILGFNVYKSVDRVVWVKLNNSVIQVNQYLDENAVQFTGQEYYYRITYITAKGESDVNQADIVSFDEQKYKVDGMNWRLYNTSLEQIRRLWLVLRHTGEEVIFLIRQFIGKRCSRCYDYVSHQPRDPNCVVCYGTGIENGYRKFNSRIHLEPATLTITRGLEGFVPAYDFRCWTISYPLLSSQDFVIRKRTGERFAVNENNKVINQGLILMQILRINLLNKDHPIYRVEV